MAAAALTWFWAGAVWALLAGLVVEGGVFAALSTLAMWPADAEATAAHARRDEFRPIVEEAIIAGMAVMGVAASLVLGLIDPGAEQVWAGLAALIGVLLQWAGLHLMYAARYAYEYYDGEPGPEFADRGGIDFKQREAPGYRDFFYFSFTIAVSYAVSDTDVTSSRVRAVVLRHILLSWLFSLVILASTVNTVTGIFMGR